MKVVGHDGQDLLAEDVDRHRTARRSFGKSDGHLVGICLSMDWVKGKSTGNHGFYHQI